MPSAPALVVGVLSAALLLLNFASPEAFLAIGTTCIVMLYLAYAMVTGPLLMRRLRGTFTADGTDEEGKPLFSLGRWGIPVNALALVYGLFMTVNLAWPRAEVYDPAGGHWYFQWFTVLFLGATLAAGLGYRAYRGRIVVPPSAAGAAVQEAGA
jgi:amino acid transporter